MTMLSMISMPGFLDASVSSSSQSGEAQTVADGFVDLLTLVEDIQVGEESLDSGFVAQTESDLNEALSETPERQQIDLGSISGTDWMMTQTGKGIEPSSNVGLERETKLGAVLTNDSFANDMKTLGMSSRLELTAGMYGKQVLESVEPLLPSAVSSWANAFEQRDLQTLSVGQKPALADKLQHVARQEMPSLEMVKALSPDSTSKPALEAMAVGGLTANFVGALKESKEDSKVGAQAQEKVGFESFVPKSFGEELGASGTIRKDNSRQEARDQQHQRSFTMSAENFVLQQQVDLQPASSTGRFVGLEQISSKSLDSLAGRLESSTLSYVADRIDALKIQGGGEMRIVLAPKELGAVEIRVSKDAGVMEISVKAENPQTASLLAKGSSELLASLKQSPGEYRLNIDSVPTFESSTPLAKEANVSTDNKAWTTNSLFEVRGGGLVKGAEQSQESGRMALFSEGRGSVLDGLTAENSLGGADQHRAPSMSEMSTRSELSGRERNGSEQGSSREQARDRWRDQIEKRMAS